MKGGKISTDFTRSWNISWDCILKKGCCSLIKVLSHVSPDSKGSLECKAVGKSLFFLFFYQVRHPTLEKGNPTDPSIVSCHQPFALFLGKKVFRFFQKELKAKSRGETRKLILKGIVISKWISISFYCDPTEKIYFLIMNLIFSTVMGDGRKPTSGSSGSAGSRNGGGSSGSGKSSAPIDYSRYVKRFGSATECGSPYCKDLNYRYVLLLLNSGRISIVSLGLGAGYFELVIAPASSSSWPIQKADMFELQGVSPFLVD